MKPCPYCEVSIPDDAGQCPSCRNVLPPTSAWTADEKPDAESIVSLPEEFVESLIGETEMPKGKMTLGGIGMHSLKVLRRLAFPQTASAKFSIGFWVLRAIGLTILASWAYFGLDLGTWDHTKLWAGLVTLVAGPLFLRLIQFVQEQFLFHGQAGQSWNDFWTFRRMMTPRSIQGAFFIGFWVLLIAGFIQVAGGFVDLVCAEKIRPSKDTSPLTTEEIAQALSGDTTLPQDVIRQLSLAVRSIPNGQAGATTETLTPARLDVLQRLSDRLLGNGPDRVHPLLRILRGVFLMVVGPLILRFTCESIILFFRVNETLTDISKLIETAGRADGRKSDRD